MERFVSRMRIPDVCPATHDGVLVRLGTGQKYSGAAGQPAEGTNISVLRRLDLIDAGV
ncbi:MAG: hypothetical protein QM579_04835 [Desulfovibrio sp.]|uniref:hypothetical protein n=1 Tax=Desulfovibrio sp. TaxID=885 RepID=UPI0039E2BDF2